jgi:iron complex outermembrane receptor protein
VAPELANQYEVGYKVRSREGAMTATVAAYQLVKHNLADYSLYPNVTTIGQARSRGLEVDVRGRFTRHLSGIASYAYTDAVITKDPTYQGQRLPEVPRNSGSLWLHYSLGENWTAGAGLFAQGLRNGDYGSDFALPGYARIDAMVSRRFLTGSWHNTIQFNVLNLTDKRYYPASHPIVEDWIQVGLARTYEITLRLNR